MAYIAKLPTSTLAGSPRCATNAEAVARSLTNVMLVPSNIASILASPSAIGSTLAAAGTFTSLSATTLTLTNSLSEVYGGTHQTSYTLGDTLYSSATNTLSKLSGNTTSTKKFLTQTGNGTVSAAPGWNTIASSDISSILSSPTAIGNVTPNTGAFTTLVASDTTLSGSLKLSGNSGLPAGGGQFLYLVSGLSSPVCGRIIIGDGSGWYFRLAKLSSSTQTDLVYFKDDGSIGLNTSDFGSGNGILSLGNAATIPATNPANAYNLYSQSASLKGRGGSGTVTTIGPAEPHCEVCGADFMLEWKNDFHGAHLKICMLCHTRDLSDKPYIHLSYSEPKEGKKAWR